MRVPIKAVVTIGMFAAVLCVFIAVQHCRYEKEKFVAGGDK